MQIQNLQLNEKLDKIAKGVNLDEQIAIAKQIAAADVTFLPFMQMATNLESKLSGLPEGMPETYKPETDIPDGIADTTARQEFRRIKNFLPGGSMQGLSGARRETMWIQMLEGMHWKEANTMVHIKDQTLLELYPNLREVLIKLNVPVNLPEKEKVKAKKPAKKAASKTV